MPEHVHILIRQPERGTLAQASNRWNRESRGVWLYEPRTRSGKLAQSLEWAQVRGEASLHSSESGGAWIGLAPRELGLEQLSSLSRRWSRTGGNRVTMDCAEAGATGDLS